MTTTIIRTPTGWCQQYHVAGRVVNGPSAPTRQRLEEILADRERILAATAKRPAKRSAK